MRNILLFILVTMLLFSCIAARNSKALTRVLGNPDLSNKAYAELVIRHPIKIDTVLKTIEGQTVITYDTTFINTTDTLKIDSSYAVRYPVTKYITKNILRVDTLLITIADNRLLDAASTRITVLKTQNLSYQNDLKEIKKGKTNWILAFSGLGLLFLLLILLLIKKKI